MLAWLSEHQMLLTWLSIASLATFIGSLLALPWMVAMIPEDYFLYGNRETTTLKKINNFMIKYFYGMQNKTIESITKQNKRI